MASFHPEKTIRKTWSRRPKNTHKGQNGRVLVVGGSPEYAGAPILASVAALRAGADLVTFAGPEKVVQAGNAFCPDVRGMPLHGSHLTESSVPALQKKAREFDVILLGNGIGKKGIPALAELISRLEKDGARMVLDAAAFDALARLKRNPENAIYLPHVGEFARWTGMDVRTKSLTARQILLRKMIGKNQQVINLKDWRSILVSCHYRYENHTGNPGMSKGGFGDVLAGLTAGFWAQGMGAFSAAACAAWLNGKMADGLHSKKGCSYLASDLLDEITRWKKTK